MTEIWEAYKLHVGDAEAIQELKSRFVSPLIDVVDYLIETFFICWHSNPDGSAHLHLRFKPKADLREKCHEKIPDFFASSGIGDFAKIEDEEYIGESKEYGKDGWKIAQKLFECSSRAALHVASGKRDAEVEPKNLFDESKFVHMILNSFGYGYLKEAAFHKNAQDFCMEQLDRLSRC